MYQCMYICMLIYIYIYIYIYTSKPAGAGFAISNFGKKDPKISDQKNLGFKKILVQKIWVRKNFGSEKNLRSDEFLDPKNIFLLSSDFLIEKEFSRINVRLMPDIYLFWCTFLQADQTSVISHSLNFHFNRLKNKK